jgi:hypothetical protein
MIGFLLVMLSPFILLIIITVFVFYYPKLIFKSKNVTVKYKYGNNMYFVTHSYFIKIPKEKCGELRFLEPKPFVIFVSSEEENHNGIYIANV